MLKSSGPEISFSRTLWQASARRGGFQAFLSNAVSADVTLKSNTGFAVDEATRKRNLAVHLRCDRLEGAYMPGSDKGSAH